MKYDVIIVGSGPAGLTAGLYTSRGGMNTVILEKETMGGELMNRGVIENYPGCLDISGPDLGSVMLEQATSYGADIQHAEVRGLAIQGNLKIVKTDQGDFMADIVIFTGGAHPRKLGVPGEDDFEKKGVFYCATCDGPHFAKKAVAIAGGGNSGITEGLFMAALESRTVIIEALPHLTADKVLQERALSNPNIEIKCGVRIEAIRGDTDVKSLDLVDVKTGQKSNLNVEGVLVRIGLDPNTSYLKDIVPLNSKGQIVVNELMETEVLGIFAAGDIRHNSVWQIASAVGDGATAAVSAGRYFRTMLQR